MKILIAIIVFNVVSLIVFFALASANRQLTPLSARVRYTELDRAGVINEDALSKFDPSYGFSKNPRATVPDYLTRPAIENATTFAYLAAALAFFNLMAISGCAWSLRRKSTEQRNDVAS